MLINIIKFIHLITTLGLFGSALFCLFLMASRKYADSHLNYRDNFVRLNKAMIILAGLAMLTGTLLVYPKHFTFHTPWIQAAYLLVTIFCLGILGSLVLIKKSPLRQKRNLWVWRLFYVMLIMILIFIIHDAVTKTTFLF